MVKPQERAADYDLVPVSQLIPLEKFSDWPLARNLKLAVPTSNTHSSRADARHHLLCLGEHIFN